MKGRKWTCPVACLLTLIILLMTLSTPALALGRTFKDVPPGHEFYDEIDDLWARGIIGGYGNTGNFKPEANLTRGQTAKMIALGAKLKVTDGFVSSLTDVNKNVDLCEHIWALEDFEIVKGWGNTGLFRPDANITRGHVAKMIVKALKLKVGLHVAKFIDLPDDKEVADAIKILASHDIVKGYGSSGLFKPDELVTRGQFSKMLSRALPLADLSYARLFPDEPKNLQVKQGSDQKISFWPYHRNSEGEQSSMLMGSVSEVRVNGVKLIWLKDYYYEGGSVSIWVEFLTKLAPGSYSVVAVINGLETKPIVFKIVP